MGEIALAVILVSVAFWLLPLGQGLDGLWRAFDWMRKRPIKSVTGLMIIWVVLEFIRRP